VLRDYTKLCHRGRARGHARGRAPAAPRAALRPCEAAPSQAAGGGGGCTGRGSPGRGSTREGEGGEVTTGFTDDGNCSLGSNLGQGERRRELWKREVTARERENEGEGHT
jgi:hypothetical protein